MKKIIALVLCLVMVFALCACGESNTATTAPAADTATEAPAEEPAEEAAPAEPAAADAVMSQDTVRIIEKDILDAYEKQQAEQKPQPAETLHPDTDFTSEFKLDLDELKFGRNYDPDKN